MGLKWFENDGEKYPVEDCIVPGGPLQNKYPLGYLIAISKEREWTGKPSCTQLLNGTRMAYLRLLCDYAENPADGVFKMLGTFAHGFVEHENENLKAEMAVEIDGITGILDSLEKLPDETWSLTDYKTSGSYKVKLFLEKQDDFDWRYQLNFYRIAAEVMGYQISKQRIFNAVRDGNTSIARSRGIDKATYYTDVEFIDDDVVMAYFAIKKEALLNHLAGFATSVQEVSGMEEKDVFLGEVYKNIPEPCNNLECWDGRKCKGYCEVAEYCKEAGGNQNYSSKSQAKNKPKGITKKGKKDPELEGF